MQTVRAVEQVVAMDAIVKSSRPTWTWIGPWIAGTVIAVLVGTWLVWFSAYLQRTFAEDDIRKACRHVMPETADRCYDTVVIQRGGVRR